MSDQTSDVSPDAAASMANAAQNAGYPATSGDAQPGPDTTAEATDTSGDTLTADSTVDDVVAYLGADGLDDAERTRRADLAEQLESERTGGPRKGVTAAIDQARQPAV